MNLFVYFVKIPRILLKGMRYIDIRSLIKRFLNNDFSLISLFPFRGIASHCTTTIPIIIDLINNYSICKITEKTGVKGYLTKKRANLVKFEVRLNLCHFFVIIYRFQNKSKNVATFTFEFGHHQAKLKSTVELRPINLLITDHPFKLFAKISFL